MDSIEYHNLLIVLLDITDGQCFFILAKKSMKCTWPIAQLTKWHFLELQYTGYNHTKVSHDIDVMTVDDVLWRLVMCSDG